MAAFQRYIRQCFSVDLRSLALMRVGVALCLLGDLFWRSLDLRAMMSDYGFLPRAPLTEFFIHPWHWSLHFMSGLTVVQGLLFLVAACAAFCLLVGFRTRTASVISWILIVSLHARNPIILQGGDVLLRLLCFWGMFLPWGARYSVDSAFTIPQSIKNHSYFSVGTLGLILQLASMYLFAALLKTAPEWHSDLSAVYYALSLDQFATPLAKTIRNYPDLMAGLTFVTFWIEALGWILWFSPVAFERCRWMGALLFIGMHLGFRMCLDVGPFTWVSISSLVVLFPSSFWGARKLKPEFTIYYDRECGFCKKMVFILKTFLVLPHAKVDSAQNDPKIERMMREKNSWVVTSAKGDNLFEYSAFIYLVEQSPIALAWLFKAFTLIGQPIYRWVANHRSSLSWMTHSIEIKDFEFRETRFLRVVGVFFILYSLWWNLGTVDSKFRIPNDLQAVGAVFRVDQYWNMFAPFPLKEDGWYVFPAKLNDGREVDLLRNGEPVSWEKPASISATFKTERWRKYLMNLWAKKNAEYRPHFARYLCRDWNSQHQNGDVLMSFQMVYNLENIGPEGRSAPEKVVLLNWNCFGGTSSQNP